MDSRKLLLLAILTITLTVPVASSSVPYLEEWGIYELDLESETITPVFTSPEEVIKVRLDSSGERMVFCMKTGGTSYGHSELYTMDSSGGGLIRLTENDKWELYPSWSPDGEEIAYLAFGDTLDLWMMDSDGENQRLFYDSGGHDADIHWVDDLVAFTRDSQIWVINSDGSDPRQITDPVNAGEWGDAVLPFGDYDPRISPDGSRIVFERLVGDSTSHGNYDLFTVNIDGSSETRLTESGWTQGLASWSNDGQKLVYTVSAIGLEGRYDLYSINPDGSDMLDLTSSLFPEGFLANSAIFSKDDSKIYFIGQWWGWEILESTITCTVSPSRVITGNPVSVTGSVGPKVGSINLEVTLSQPGGAETVYDVTTENGDYVLNIEPDQIGAWHVQASWAGDSGHSESSSVLHEFTVVEESEPEPNGIPGFYLEAVLAGLILYYLYRGFY